MSAYLLLVTLGPVQDFIAQARRTRDLWYGSHLLSELSRSAARALIDHRAELVYPALTRGDPELEACPSPLRTNGNPPQNIPNKLLAVVPDGIDAGQVARDVRSAIRAFWRDEVSSRAWEIGTGGLVAKDAEGILAAWNEQIDTFLEFTAAWVPRTDDYTECWERVNRAVAARKNLRDFHGWSHQRKGAAKSSLDGARDTVLLSKGDRDPVLTKKFRIASGEELDAIGLVKRVGGHPDPFPPITNVALASYLQVAGTEVPDALGQLKHACAQLKGLDRLARSDIPCIAEFPFHAEILLPNRWKAMMQERGIERDLEAWGKRYVTPIIRALGEPYPYVACLRADGDRMGETISGMSSADQHREFSCSVSGFAAEARRIVEQEHRGSLVYAGGDDVLAFVSLPEALSCADDLRRAFAAMTAELSAKGGFVQMPTLSVGIGVGHIMDGMGDLLALGSEAESLAKHGPGAGRRGSSSERNALAVVVDKRSGGKLSWRAQWTDCEGDPVARLQQDVCVLREQLSIGKLYELQHRLASLPRPEYVSEGQWGQVLRLEVRDILAHVQKASVAGDGLLPEDLGLSLAETDDYAAIYNEVAMVVDRLLVARIFAMSTPRSRRPGEEAVQWDPLCI